jgi:hypothetical protein
LQDSDELFSDMGYPEECKCLDVSLWPVLENLTKKRPENSKVLWKTPFAPSLPMTKVMHLTIASVNFARWPASQTKDRSDRQALSLSNDKRKTKRHN